jgi:hypothetical protein
MLILNQMRPRLWTMLWAVCLPLSCGLSSYSAAQESADPGRLEARAAANPGRHTILSASSLLGALQGFLAQRDVALDHLRADPAVRLMVDWFRFEPVAPLDASATADALVYRYGGWSEGCATAYKLSMLRRLTVRAADGSETQSIAGITLLFEPGNLTDLPEFAATSSEFDSIEAFLATVEGSSGFRVLAAATPIAVALETGGLR